MTTYHRALTLLAASLFVVGCEAPPSPPPDEFCHDQYYSTKSGVRCPHPDQSIAIGAYDADGYRDIVCRCPRAGKDAGR